jgi:hypothetical protein
MRLRAGFYMGARLIVASLDIGLGPVLQFHGAGIRDHQPPLETGEANSSRLLKKRYTANDLRQT